MDDIGILFADDDDGMRLMMRRFVEKAGGFQIVGEAKDGRELIRLNEQTHPQVILLDVEMPVMTGVECARIIQDINPKTILVFATAHEGAAQYCRKVDKREIPVCPILGVNIAVINMNWLLKYLAQNIHQLQGDYICVSNVHTTVVSYEDADYRAVQNGGLMAIPDGNPLAQEARRRGYPQIQRTTGPDLMMEVFRQSTAHGWRHYFYGSTQEVQEKMIARLQQEYPGLVIAGTDAPPFRELTPEEDALAVARINQAQPDFVWVGLGAPKQERWMAAHQGRVHGLMIGVGAGFDFFSGNVRRAPLWMQKHSLEWLYRLMQDPKRLFQRYWSTNLKFIWNATIRRK